MAFVYRNQAGQYLCFTGVMDQHFKYVATLAEATVDPKLDSITILKLEHLKFERVDVEQLTSIVPLENQTIKDFLATTRKITDGKGITGVGAYAAIWAMSYHWNDQLGNGENTSILMDDIKELSKLLNSMIQDVENLSSFDGQGLTPLVSASMTSDNEVVSFGFNAALWLKEASEDEIAGLQNEGWSCSPEADAVAYFFEPRLKPISGIFGYIHDQNKHVPESKAIGFRVEIDGEDALNWLQRHRPNLAATLYCQRENISVTATGNDPLNPWVWTKGNNRSSFGFHTKAYAEMSAWNNRNACKPAAGCITS